MKKFYPPKVKKLLEVFTTSPAETSEELRRNVVDRAAGLGGADRAAEGIPGEVRDFIDKVALHAYKVSDEDILELKRSGYSEEAFTETATRYHESVRRSDSGACSGSFLPP
jgi:hypothetical protein